MSLLFFIESRPLSGIPKMGDRWMPDDSFDQEEGGFTERDFVRRYYSSEATVPSVSEEGQTFRRVNQEAPPGAARPGGRRNKFMRTLIRRHLVSSAPK
jgi:hypothetical protein